MSQVLIYADVDVNIIDGSAIWLSSLAELLAGSEEIDVTILSKTRVNRDAVIGRALAAERVTLLDPWELANADVDLSRVLSLNGETRLSPSVAASAIIALDQKRLFDLLIIRGIDIADVLSNLPSMAVRTWVYITDPMNHASVEETEKLRRIFSACRRVLCQTEEARQEVLNMVASDDLRRTAILPPMVPSLGTDQPLRREHPPRLAYSGKFSPPYMLLEMLDAFREIRVELPSAQFYVFGDNFHNAPRVPGFRSELTYRLITEEGVIWHGGVERTVLLDMLRDVDVASSWRHRSFDDSLELSTKVLEYGSLGIPVLINPSRVQYRLFGPDYPGYVATRAKFVEKFIQFLSSPELWETASSHVRRVAERFSYESIRRELLPLLERDARAGAADAEKFSFLAQLASPPAPEAASLQAVEYQTSEATPAGIDAVGRLSGISPARPVTILFAGHDFKFARHLIDFFSEKPRFAVLTDETPGHVLEDADKSAELLKQADVIFCEWALGNAEWYSKHKLDHQVLIVRLHAQELYLPYISTVWWQNVDRVVLVSDEYGQILAERFPAVEPRVRVIRNIVDCAAFDLEKLPGHEFHLGMVGIVPRQKSPHLALALLEQLRRHDERYQLFIKGKLPSEYAWLKGRNDEQQYYKRWNSLVKRSPARRVVHFDGFGDDVAQWFRKIGFVVSASEHESSHLAVAEGMAAGTLPVIRNWPGAETHYPPHYVVSFGEQEFVDDAASKILKQRTRTELSRERQVCKEFAREHFDASRISAQYLELIAELIESK